MRGGGGRELEDVVKRKRDSSEIYRLPSADCVRQKISETKGVATQECRSPSARIFYQAIAQIEG